MARFALAFAVVIVPPLAFLCIDLGWSVVARGILMCGGIIAALASWVWCIGRALAWACREREDAD